MSETPPSQEMPAPEARRTAWNGLWPFALAVGLIWLGWQIALIPITSRLASEHAVRLNPGSHRILARAAEDELRAGRHDNARALARMSLVRAPFDARALRILGVSEAETGDADRAEQLVTLAGNWSLRDDTSHSWLVAERLRRGNYASAFAHADTLVRRRPALQPQIFDLFSTALESDPRVGGHLVTLLAQSPPWRAAYLASLYRRPEGLSRVASLAIGLKGTAAPFSSRELQRLYQVLYSQRRIPGLKAVRAEIGQPDPTTLLINGDFAVEPAILPFDWSLGVDAGISVAIVSDDHNPGDSALRVAHNGRNMKPLAQQVLLLEPGRYRLGGRSRLESGRSDSRLVWQVQCLEDATVIGEARFALNVGSQVAWAPFETDFSVPDTGCSAQTLTLALHNPGRRTRIVTWFSQLRLVRIN